MFWYQKAAEQGDTTAQNNLGVCYANGYGIDQDQTKKIFWYRKAADQSCAIAQNNLGWCYENGGGVEKDPALAVYWYYKAADQGHERARSALRNIVDQRFPPEDKA